MQAPNTTDEVTIQFNGLRAGTAYTFMIEAVSRDNPSRPIGKQITTSLSTCELLVVVDG